MENYYNTLFPYAYNILGSADEAQDAIQDVLLKYAQQKQEPENEKNYLIRSVINQSINIKRNAKRNESLESLPQPIDTSATDLSIELKDLVSYSLLILLEKLNPKERAVFILKEAFAYTHEEIGQVIAVSPENARKLLSRARSKLDNLKGTKGKKVSQAHFKQLHLLTEALQARDMDGLHQLFHEEIEFRADGGSQVQVVAKYLKGLHEVSALIMEVFLRFQAGYQVKYLVINHQPAILYYEGRELKVVQVFELEAGKIKSINVILDPQKLDILPFSK